MHARMPETCAMCSATKNERYAAPSVTENWPTTPDSSPEAELLAQGHRHKTASLLNAAILNAQQLQTEPKLPMMLRAMQWAQAELHDHHRVDFPCILDMAEAMPRLQHDGQGA